MPEDLYVRVKQALTWLKRNKGILQKDIADKMGMAEASFTRALARIKEKNDKDFIISFHSVVSEYISLDYLLHGNGTLTDTNSLSHSNQEEGIPSMSSVFNSALAKADQTIEALKIALRTKDEQLAEKDARIKEKDERIAELKAHNVDLRRQLNQYQSSDIDRYPFPIGAADGDKRQSKSK